MTKRIKFRKLERNEIIGPCDFHSLDDGKSVFPIIREDSIGKTPEDFATDRSFWRVMDIED